MIDQMIVGERFEKFDGLSLVIVAPSCRLCLTGPKYGGVLGMPLFKRFSNVSQSCAFHESSSVRMSSRLFCAM
jgi:hypothetical protein